MTTRENDELSTPNLIESRRSFTGDAVSVESKVVQVASNKMVKVDCINFSNIALVIGLLGESVIMTRQFRYPPWLWLIEAPAGRIEPNETATETAIREFREETGYSCESIEEIGQLRASPHLSNETTFVFTASGLRRGPTMHEAGEIMTISHIAVVDLRRYIKQGLLVDAKTIAALVLAGLL